MESRQDFCAVHSTMNLERAAQACLSPGLFNA
jgi:hypothetical protein